MADFFPPMNMTCQKVAVTRNEWSDYIMGVTTSLSCHFRAIDRMARVSHGEENDADAMIWFPYNTSIVDGDIILFDAIYYQIERIYHARRLGETNVQFIKCDLKVTDPGIS